MSRLRLDWTQFDGWIKNLAETLSGEIDWDQAVILAEPRGGVVPAVALSHRLGVPVVYSIRELRELYPNTGDGDHVIWIDDIVDSGRTVIALLEALPEATLVAWVARAQCAHFPKIRCGVLMEPDVWAVFPWEDPDNWASEKAKYETNRRKVK